MRAKKKGACTHKRENREKGELSISDIDMPTITCAHCTGNGSTLGLLTKHWRVRADPTLRWETAETEKLPKLKTLAVSDAAACCGRKMHEKMRNRENEEKELKTFL
jgi:hypothetical protein